MTLKAFNIMKSDIEEEDGFSVELPDKDASDIILAIDDLR